MKNIILLAAQGAGKGTIAGFLKEKYGYIHISTGDLLRERSLAGDELGNKIKNLIDNGILVSDDIIFEAIEARITSDECRNGYILDGIPRTLKQAIIYDELLKKINFDQGIVINLTIPEEVLVDRITSRRVCPKCNKIYNINFIGSKPKAEGICDECETELVFRIDDQNAEAISKRIRTYHENASDIINFYKEKGELYIVDATESKKAFFEIEKVII